MSRPATGLEVIEEARKQLREAKSIEELKRAQAVIFPLDFGLTMEETGKAIGVSKGWACQMRRDFIRFCSAGETERNMLEGKKGKKRNRAYMAIEEEAAFLAQFTAKAEQAGILIVSEIHQAVEQKLGHSVSLATTYNLLHRHGWRKLAPDKRHPKANVESQEDWKKNSDPSSKKSIRIGQEKAKGEFA